MHTLAYEDNYSNEGSYFFASMTSSSNYDDNDIECEGYGCDNSICHEGHVYYNIDDILGNGFGTGYADYAGNCRFIVEFGEAEFVNYTGQKYVAVLKDNVVFAKNVETGVTRRMMNSRSSKIVSCQNTGMHDISVVYADGVVIVWNPLTDRMQQLL